MSPDALLLLLYVGLALGFSFLCSIAEAVLLSITPSYIEAQRDIRPRLAALLTRLKQENVDQSLAAILTLNTIAHTVGAIGAGAKATVVFGSAWFGLFSAVMTLLILFASEIVPKTIGAVYWSRLARPTALFVRTLIVALYPLVWISERLTRWISRGRPTHIFSREEFLAMSRMGEESGLIKNKEFRVIRNLFRLDGLQARDIMTPRPVMEALPENMSMEDAFEKVTTLPFSRLPLYRTDSDDISGFVLKDDILLDVARGRRDGRITELRRELLVVPEMVPLSSLFDQLLNDRQHIALVVDEYGGTRGLVTLEDLLETLIGIEIMDESDKVDDMRALARKLWKERARALGVVEDDDAA
ncbi:MAG: hemolysin [Bacteroidetes bacterium CG12_big_fil_rev_8_21_14_0_65_60_17]|nr:MAG: hemolysin [Bacteroidetes bacterium CG12_big_fil_rev_8_21_14_0_65_60_17]